MADALKKIEADVMGAGRKKGKFRAVPVISFDISISKFFENVNPQDKNFNKYVPESFLKENQKAAKDEAVTSEVVKITKKFKKTNGKHPDYWKDTNAVYDKITAALNPYRLAMNAQVDRAGCATDGGKNRRRIIERR
ncbi:MAG: hypothetical protein IJC46_07015 [Clostridia bacterium]|nr:hypothetical protein [Clostridia bacterium]